MQADTHILHTEIITLEVPPLSRTEMGPLILRVEHLRAQECIYVCG